MFILKDLIRSTIHLGHKTNRWNPRTACFLFGIKNDLHIVDLEQTIIMLRRALSFIKTVCENRGYILYVPWLNPWRNPSSTTQALVSQGSTQESNGIIQSNIHQRKDPTRLQNLFESFLSSPDAIATAVETAMGTKKISKLGRKISQTNHINKNIKDKTPESSKSIFTLETIPANRFASRPGNLNKKKNKAYPMYITNQFQALAPQSVSSADAIATVATASPILRERVSALIQNKDQRFFIPQVLFISNLPQNKILIKEAIRLEIPIIGIVDSDADPLGIDFPIPGNDNESTAHTLYLKLILNAIIQGKKNEIKKTQSLLP